MRKIAECLRVTLSLTVYVNIGRQRTAANVNIRFWVGPTAYKFLSTVLVLSNQYMAVSDEVNIDIWVNSDVRFVPKTLEQFLSKTTAFLSPCINLGFLKGFQLLSPAVHYFTYFF